MRLLNCVCPFPWSTVCHKARYLDRSCLLAMSNRWEILLRPLTWQNTPMRMITNFIWLSDLTVIPTKPYHECSYVWQIWGHGYQTTNWKGTTRLKISSYAHHASYRNKFQLTASAGAINIAPSTSVRNIGIELDQMLRMSKQVNSLCSRCHFHLRIFLTLDAYWRTTTIPVHAYVTPRFDSGNSLLFDLPVIADKLQRVQNAAARLVTGAGYREHITPVLRKLYI